MDLGKEFLKYATKDKGFSYSTEYLWIYSSSD